MIVTSELVSQAKIARRMTTNAYDAEVIRLLNAALLDMGVAGVVLPDYADALTSTAAITYFLMHFGQPDNYDRLKASYDEQKAQLATCTGYTDWGETTATEYADTYDITIDSNLSVVTNPADIIGAFTNGSVLRIAFGLTTMYMQSATYDGETLIVTFSRGASLYTLTATATTATFETVDAHTEG